MIAIIADETCENVGKRIEERFQKSGRETALISTAGLQIGTCYSCGYCSTKEYGKCFQKDDMDAILRILVKSETMIIVSPIVFGSYSFGIKSIMDRICVISDSHYYVVKGEMVKGMRSDLAQLEIIGVKSDCSKKEWEYFKSLALENIKIINRPGHVFLLNRTLYKHMENDRIEMCSMENMQDDRRQMCSMENVQSCAGPNNGVLGRGLEEAEIEAEIRKVLEAVSHE